MPYQKSKTQEPAEKAPVSREARPESQRFSWFIEGPIYLLVFFTPLAIGTAHLWSASIMLAVSLVAFVALIFRKRRSQRRFLVFPMGVALLAAAGFTLWQLLPLPAFLVGWLNPGAANLYDYLLSGSDLWTDSSWRALSLDTPGTAGAVIYFSAYALAFLVVVNYFNQRRRSRRLLKAIAWSGFSVALIGFFSKLFMAKSIWGIYPVAADTFFFSTFINANHLAGFLGLCAPIALGIGLSARGRQNKALFGFMGVIIGAAVFLSLSRGGIVALLIGLVFLLFFSAARRVRNLERTFLVQAAVAGVLVLAAYLAYDTVIKELRSLGDLEAIQEEVKIRSWAGTVPMMAEHPLVGIGKGAYATVYPRYKTIASDRTFHHAENQLLQVLVEWGLPFGLFFLAAFLAMFALALSRARHSMTMGGCLAGVFTVGLQNLVDFNLEVGGVAFSFVVVMAVLSAALTRHAGPPRSLELRPRLSATMMKALALVVLLVAVPCGWHASRHALKSASATLLAAQASGSAEPCDPGPLGEAACDLLRYHPGDYLAPLVIGRAYLEQLPEPNLPRAVHWLARALFLNPTAATIHQLAGRALYLAGFHDQALVEYQSAAQWDPSVLTATTMEVMRLTGDADMAIRATPVDGDLYLRLARNLRNLGKTDACAKAARLALEQDSTLIAAMDLLADLAFRAGRYDEALASARRIVEVDPLYDRAYSLQGRVLRRNGQTLAAEKIWQAGLLQVPDSSLISQHLVELYLSDNRIPEAEGVATRLHNYAASDDVSQSRLHFLLGRISEVKGSLVASRRSYRLAATLAPRNLWYLYRVGQMGEKMGDREEAKRIYLQLITARFREQEIKARMTKMMDRDQRQRQDAMWRKWVDQDSDADGKGEPSEPEP